MSKIGKKPVIVPSGVKVDIKDGLISITGPKGNLSRLIHEDMTVALEGETIVVTRPSDNKKHRSLHGLTRSLIQNMVTGVSVGYTITLEINGIGYRAEMKGSLLELQLGFSHSIMFRAAEGVTLDVVPKVNKITVTGINKELVGSAAAEIRSLRPPEPYKGKGIKYDYETIRRKAGKAAVGSGA